MTRGKRPRMTVRTDTILMLAKLRLFCEANGIEWSGRLVKKKPKRKKEKGST